jgi:hypothetical protein
VGIAGNGAITSITPTTNYTSLLNIATPNTLTNGIHNLYIRVQDDNGHWSIAERRLFFIDNYTGSDSIVAYQYYFDTDPGVGVTGNGAIVPVSPATSYSTTVSVPIGNTLSNGIHNLYIRMKDQAGKWSITERRLFFIDNAISVNIVALECFYDNDPGVGNGINIPMPYHQEPITITYAPKTATDTGVYSNEAPLQHSMEWLHPSFTMLRLLLYVPEIAFCFILMPHQALITNG